MEKDWVVLKIDEQHMWVSLAIKVPEGEEETSFSTKFIKEYLKENGIVAGIKDEAVEALASYTAYGTDVVVAEGKPAVNGKDGFYQYLVPLEDDKSKPVVNPDGSVDYANSLKLAMVKEDDLVAVYVPATKGEYGYTVFSEVLKPIPGKELRPLRSKGLVASEDNKEYRAGVAGRIYKENEKIIIDKIYVINGDLDIEQGNVSFNGDVEVRGDVRSGLRIETEGSIFIHGHVGNCYLKAGKNITIQKGIQGKNGCRIIAGEDVAGSFIERCNIEANGCVYANSILDSKVYARKQVIVTSKSGHIIGGEVTGMQGVTAKSVGNEAGVVTKIHFAETREFIMQISSYKEKLKKVKADVEFLEKQLRIFDSLDGSKRTKETEATKMKIIRAKVIRTAERNQLEEMIRNIGEEVAEANKNSIVRVTNVVYPRTRIYSNGNLYVQQEAYKDVKYKVKGDEIVIMSGDE